MHLDLDLHLVLYAELDLHWMTRGLGYRGNGLVTKRQQVNKTVFVFFPSSKLISPRLDDCILSLHPVVSLAPHFAYCILSHITCNKLQLSLCKESMLFIFY